MNQEAIKEIVQSFADSGWDNDNSFFGYLVIGFSGDNLSIVAHNESWETTNPIFELIDYETNKTYWVKEVPTTQQAQQLLEEHGEIPEKW
jgi:hypothetical protein